MWALETFTDINGATRIVPDSHRWPPSRTPGPDDTVLAAEMPKGSALFYLGSVWHGGGANRDRRPRAGLINTYCLGWLRQEVNHFLAVPRATAAALPEHVQRLMGYSLYDGMLGYYILPIMPRALGDMRCGPVAGNRLTRPSTTGPGERHDPDLPPADRLDSLMGGVCPPGSAQQGCRCRSEALFVTTRRFSVATGYDMIWYHLGT